MQHLFGQLAWFRNMFYDSYNLEIYIYYIFLVWKLLKLLIFFKIKFLLTFLFFFIKKIPFLRSPSWRTWEYKRRKARELFKQKPFKMSISRSKSSSPWIISNLLQYLFVLRSHTTFPIFCLWQKSPILYLHLPHLLLLSFSSLLFGWTRSLHPTQPLVKGCSKVFKSF